MDKCDVYIWYTYNKWIPLEEEKVEKTIQTTSLLQYRFRPSWGNSVTRKTWPSTSQKSPPLPTTKSKSNHSSTVSGMQKKIKISLTKYLCDPINSFIVSLFIHINLSTLHPFHLHYSNPFFHHSKGSSRNRCFQQGKSRRLAFKGREWEKWG